MDRPKRNTSKPRRYMTTSSDEALKEKKKTNNITTGNIDEDIDDIRSTLENFDDDLSDNNLSSHTPIQNLSQHTYIHTNSESYTNIQPHTNTQSYTNIQPYTNTQSDTIFSSQTSVQSHTNFQSHTNSQLDRNVSPHTSIQPHENILSYSSSQLDRNVLPDRQTQPHTSHYTTISRNVTHMLPTHSSIHNNTPLHIENDTNNSFVEFQNTSRTTPGSQPDRHTEIPRRNVQLEETDNRKTHERLQHIEREIKKMNGILENILQYVQNRQRIPRKPNILPISSLAEMDTFENIDDNIYSDVVNYFRYIGGFNLKEAINLCFKEGLKDTITPGFTWWGREGQQRPLYNTRFTMTIYEAMCNNKHFDKPTRSEFQAHMREALRTAKERLRSKTRGHRMQMVNNRNRRNLWSDERSDTEHID